MSVFALIGDPVSGSPSPAMHGAAFRALGLPHRYEAIRVTRSEVEDTLPDLAARLAGLNVTTPLKGAVLPFLDEVDPPAAEAGSVNTIVVRDGRTLGHSTDGPGFLDVLRDAGASFPSRTIVLGTGGAARAVTHALLGAGSSVAVWGRRPAEAERLAAGLGAEAARELAPLLRDADLLVNATPVGGAVPGDPLPGDSPLPPVVFDLVIRPRRTPLLRRAEAAGSRTIEGVEMLVRQGARCFELWTGVPAPVEVMREAAARALASPAEVPA